MAFENLPGGGTIVTGEADIQLARLFALRSALGLEIRTGMKRSSRGRSTMAIVQSIEGITTAKTKAKVYADLNAFIVAHGGQDRPLAK